MTELIGGPSGLRGLAISPDLLFPLLELVDGEDGLELEAGFLEVDGEAFAFGLIPGVRGDSGAGDLARLPDLLLGSREVVLRRGRTGEELCPCAAVIEERREEVLATLEVLAVLALCSKELMRAFLCLNSC